MERKFPGNICPRKMCSKDQYFFVCECVFCTPRQILPYSSRSLCSEKEAASFVGLWDCQ